MAAASRGASAAGGTTLGILPGDDRGGRERLGVGVAVATGIGELRNGLLVRSVDALVSVGGSWGTLSEIALACRTGVPVWSGWPAGTCRPTAARWPSPTRPRRSLAPWPRC